MIIGELNGESLKYNPLTGELWKLARRRNRHNKTLGYVLNQACDSHGYYHISIAGKKVLTTRVIMQLVGNDTEGLQVRHLDGDIKNNRLSNLALGTAKDNMNDQRNPRPEHLPDNVVKSGKRYRVEMEIKGARYRPYFDTIQECTDFVRAVKLSFIK